MGSKVILAFGQLCIFGKRNHSQAINYFDIKFFQEMFFGTIKETNGEIVITMYGIQRNAKWVCVFVDLQTYSYRINILYFDCATSFHYLTIIDYIDNTHHERFFQMKSGRPGWP